MKRNRILRIAVYLLLLLLGDCKTQAGETACFEGERKCVGATVYRCDPAGTFQPLNTCAPNEICQKGICACANQCEQMGEKTCDGETDYRICEEGPKGCYQWSYQRFGCDPDKICTAGECECDHQCEEGEINCVSPSAYSVCDTTTSGCRVWGTETIGCGDYQKCEEGACLCDNQCDTVNEIRCETVGGIAYTLCAENEAQCRYWAAKNCGSLQTCTEDNTCECTHLCEKNGCADLKNHVDCLFDADNCRYLSRPFQCSGARSGCYEGSCLPMDYFVLTTFTGSFGQPKIAALSSDKFAITWSAKAEETGSDDVFARIFTQFGEIDSAEFIINTQTIADQNTPALAGILDNRFAIIWSSLNTGDGIRAKIFTIQGVEITTEFKVNTTDHSLFKSLALSPLSNSSFIALWEAEINGGSSHQIYAQGFDLQGALLGAELMVNSDTTGALKNPNIALLSNGNFIIVWRSELESGNRHLVYFNLYSSAFDTILTGQVANIHTTYRVETPAAVGTANGEFFIVWSQEGIDGDGYGIAGNHFTSDGNRLTTDLLINHYTPGDQKRPTLASYHYQSPVYIGWDSEYPNGNRIVGRFFSIGSHALGPEYVINAFTSGNYANPSVCALSNFYVITWAGNPSEISYPWYNRNPE